MHGRITFPCFPVACASTQPLPGARSLSQISSLLMELPFTLRVLCMKYVLVIVSIFLSQHSRIRAIENLLKWESKDMACSLAPSKSQSSTDPQTIPFSKENCEKALSRSWRWQHSLRNASVRPRSPLLRQNCTIMSWHCCWEYFSSNACCVRFHAPA